MASDERVLKAGAAVRRIAVLAVLAPLSVAATTGLLRPTASTVQPAALGGQVATAAEPEVPAVPELPADVDQPASVTSGTSRDTPGLGQGLGVVTDARYAAVDAIPGRALTAYQRAQTVMVSADPACHVSWQLVAAIGKIESNHGQFGGALMTADGVVHPAIYGPRLDGKGATSRIADTDAGLLDGDADYDRAVGPMQFIPSTWTLVGVDADGDGRRDPQDIDDAALAAAVYLCSGDDDLATRAGQRSAVHRYNHSKAYVDTVIAVMAGYLHADPALFGVTIGTGYDTTLPPTGGTAPQPAPSHAAPTFEVVPTATPTGSPTATPTGGPTGSPTSSPTSGPTGKPGNDPTDRPPLPEPTPTATPTGAASPTGAPSATVRPTPTAAPPSSQPPGDPTGGPSSEPTGGPTSDPTGGPTSDPTGDPTGGPTGGPSDPGDPGDPDVPQALLDAWTACLATGVDAADLGALTSCLVQQTGTPADDPVLQWLLAHPPATPPTSTQTQQQSRRRRPAA